MFDFMHIKYPGVNVGVMTGVVGVGDWVNVMVGVEVVVCVIVIVGVPVIVKVGVIVCVEVNDGVIV